MKIIKVCLGVILICTALVSFITGNLGGVTFIILGLILLPPVSKVLREKLPFWNYRLIRYTSYFLIFFSTAFLVKPNKMKVDKDKYKVTESNPNNSSVESEEKINGKSTYNGNGELVSSKDNELNVNQLKWSSGFTLNDLKGKWLLNYYSSSNEEYYINDGNEEQKRLKLSNSTYQTSYPYGGGDNPEFNYNIENDELIVKMKSQLASEIYRYRVSISNDKKYLRLIENQNSIQVFKREN